MPLFLLKLLPILGKIWPYLAGTALLFGAYLYIDHKGYERAQQKADIELSKIKEASSKSEALAWKQKAQDEERYAEHAKETDDQVANLKSDFAANLMRYAQAQHSAGQANPKSSVDYSKSSDRSGGDPVLSDQSELKITIADAKICSNNTARLVEVKKWGDSILADQSKDSEKQPTNIETNSSASNP
jgi:hypothetical protein